MGERMRIDDKFYDPALVARQLPELSGFAPEGMTLTWAMPDGDGRVLARWRWVPGAWERGDRPMSKRWVGGHWEVIPD